MENNENNENKSSVYTQVPAKVSAWTSFKNFLFQDIVVEITPKQQRIFKEVRDFWTQEIYFDNGFHLRPYSLRFDNENQEQDVKVSL